MVRYLDGRDQVYEFFQDVFHIDGCFILALKFVIHVQEWLRLLFTACEINKVAFVLLQLLIGWLSANLLFYGLGLLGFRELADSLRGERLEQGAFICLERRLLILRRLLCDLFHFLFEHRLIDLLGLAIYD